MSVKENMTVIVITHNSALADMGNKVIHVKSGKITSVDINENIEECIGTIEVLFKSYQLKKQVYHRNGRLGYFDATS